MSLKYCILCRCANDSSDRTSRGAVSDLANEVKGWCKPVQAVVKAVSF